MKSARATLLFVAAAIATVIAAQPRRAPALPPIVQTWTIKHKTVTPDGVPKLVPVVNDQYPGPELRGRAGQRVIITVVNRLPLQSTSIHWHGIKQVGTPVHDGVPGVTQCGIAPGHRHVYNFTLDGPGTLWWHSHSGFQKSSLYGAIVVEGNEPSPALRACAHERTLLLNDWYHTSGSEQITGLLDVPFKWVGDGASLLINGEGVFDCTAVFGSDAARDDCRRKSRFYKAVRNAPGPFRLDVEYDTCYRLRVVGASSLALINLGVEAHMLTVVEAETTLLQPFDTDFLDVGSGQSYSVLLRTKSKADVEKLSNGTGKFWIQMNVRHRTTGPVGRAILAYPSAAKNKRPPTQPVPHAPEREDIAWTLREARRQKALQETVLPKATRRVTILGTQNQQADKGLRWALNNISFVDPATPVLHALTYGVEEETAAYVSAEWPPTEFDYSQSLGDLGLPLAAKAATFVLKVKKDEVVDFVFQNTVALNGAPEFHPWHLHLHNFWVLNYGDPDTVETYADRLKYTDKTDAVARNTFGLYPNAWTAIRVKFDNPGAAHFHCHILSHLVMGMGFVVQIGEQSDMPVIPDGIDLCGALSKTPPPAQCAA